MNRRFFSHEEIQTPSSEFPDPYYLLYTIRGSFPLHLLVWRHPVTGSIQIRTATMNPLTWSPYSMSVSFPRTDRQVVETLRSGDQCVMAWGGQDLVRASYLASLTLPDNLDILQICRLKAIPSPYSGIPHLVDCPLNIECRVDQTVDYASHRVYFLVVEYLSLDEEVLLLKREEVIQRYHLYEVDRIRHQWDGEQVRFGLMGEIFQCPTFPVGPKQGWYSTFKGWMTDLKTEGYLSEDEYAKIIEWYERWMAIFEDLNNPERPLLRQKLTTVCQAIAWQEWDRLHQTLTPDNTQ